MRYKGNQYKCTELGFTQLHQTNTTGYNGQIGPDTTTLGDCNIPVSSTKRSFKKINNVTSELNHTMDQMVLKDDYRIFLPLVIEHTFFTTVMEFSSK